MIIFTFYRQKLDNDGALHSVVCTDRRMIVIIIEAYQERKKMFTNTRSYLCQIRKCEKFVIIVVVVAPSRFKEDDDEVN